MNVSDALLGDLRGTVHGCVCTQRACEIPPKHMTRFTGVIMSRFILNLRDLSEMSSTELASNPSQVRTLAFAQSSRIVGSVGLHLESPRIEEASHEIEGTDDEATQLLMLPLGRANTDASNSSSYSEFAYLQEVRQFHSTYCRSDSHCIA